MSQADKAGSQYWDLNWKDVEVPPLFDATNQSLDNYVNIQLHKYFKMVIGTRKNFSVLEIGCANSIWPLYFYKYFNAKVYGLDYSEVGCEKSRRLFKHFGVPGEIYCADLFAPPAELLGKFDLVVSFGVVEHFQDTAGCLKACSAFVKPGGQLLSLIPNMNGIIGFLQKIIARDVYDVHVPLSKKQFAAAHQQAKLNLNNCDYFMTMNLNVVNLGSFSPNYLNKFIQRSFSSLSKLTWILEKYGIKIPKSSLTSPYIIALTNVDAI